MVLDGTIRFIGDNSMYVFNGMDNYIIIINDG